MLGNTGAKCLGLAASRGPINGSRGGARQAANATHWGVAMLLKVNNLVNLQVLHSADFV
jgi:hypothetical protein